jgi:predicted double-glycine peptidase
MAADAKPPASSRRRILRVLGPGGILILVVAGIWLGKFHAAEPRLNRLPMVRQATPYTCGAAVLESVLAYYGQEFREDDLARELKSDPEQGTNHQEMVRFARAQGLTVDVFEHMKLEDLRKPVSAGYPVVVAFQAWRDKPVDYAGDWEDGHYAIVIGMDTDKIYFMDPSTTGDYTYIPIPEFLTRWRDYYLERDGRRVNLVHFGMIFRSNAPPAFDPTEIKPLQ